MKQYLIIQLWDRNWIPHIIINNFIKPTSQKASSRCANNNAWLLDTTNNPIRILLLFQTSRCDLYFLRVTRTRVIIQYFNLFLSHCQDANTAFTHFYIRTRWSEYALNIITVIDASVLINSSYFLTTYWLHYERMFPRSSNKAFYVSHQFPADCLLRRAMTFLIHLLDSDIYLIVYNWLQL